MGDGTSAMTWNRFFARIVVLTTWATGLLTASGDAAAAEMRFERIVIDSDLRGAYQVEVADVNGDGKLDVVAVGGGTCAWYENPGWTKHIVSTSDETAGIISSATADIDGDGKAEIAIAYEFEMNQPKRGMLLLAIPGEGGRWTLRPIEKEIGSIHRLRWGDLDGDGRPELVVAPIFGPNAKPPVFDQDPAQLSVYRVGKDAASGPWERRVIARRPVMHAIEVAALEPGARAEILTADNLGVARVQLDPGSDEYRVTPLVPGAPGEAPKRGCSEIHRGRLRDGRTFLATIEPWHGSEVVVWPSDSNGGFGDRTVIDDTLVDGHAFWVADVDRDGNDEIFAGHRGKDHRVSVYHYDGKTWARTVIDRDVAAQDLRGGDLNGDGRPDVVTVGGSTHNVVLYRSQPAQ